MTNDEIKTALDAINQRLDKLEASSNASVNEQLLDTVKTHTSQIEHLETNQGNFITVVDQLNGRLEVIEETKNIKNDKGLVARVNELERRAGI